MVCTARQSVIVRRVVVVIGLLCLHSLFTYVWYVSLNRKPTQFLLDYGRPIAYFTWGASGSIPVLIGIWLVAREQLFGSLTGCLRAAAYLSAAFYGWVIGSVVQDWLHSQSQSMPIPGADLEHYGLGVLLTVETAVSAWLFWPMLYVFRRRLTNAELTPETTPRPNIRFLLLWTAQAALILTTLRLLATYGRPLNIGIAHGSILSAIAEQIARMPLRVVQLVAIAIIMIGFAGNLRRSFIAVIGALVVWFVGVQLVLWATELFQDPRTVYGVMADPLELRLPYQAGTIFAATVVFCFARLTGLDFRNAPANG